jgi:type IV pilus assembly protein PilW
MMIAVTMGLVVTGAVIATFVGMQSASTRTSGAAALADNGRIALDVIQQALRSAGYMACNTTRQQTLTLPASPTPMTYDFTEALSGYEAVGTSPGDSFQLSASPAADTTTSDWATSTELGDALDASVVSQGAAGNGPPIKGSDVLAVHETYEPVAPVYSTATSGANTVPVTSTTGLLPGQIGIVSDCANSTVDLITAASGNSVTFSTALPSTFGAGSEVGVADTVVFYIGVGADGDGALYSYSLAGNSSFTTPAVEVVPDIENMQILYGVDTNGSLAATEYVTADEVPAAVTGNTTYCPTGYQFVEFNCVISIKIAVLAASPLNATQLPQAAQTYSLLGTTVTAPIDTRERQEFEMTISLRDATN